MSRLTSARKSFFLMLVVSLLACAAMIAVGASGVGTSLSSSSNEMPAVATYPSTVTPSTSASTTAPVIAIPSTVPPSKKAAASAPLIARIDPAPPVRLHIPSAHINYPVAELPQESVTQITETSVKIDPPENPNEVYWLPAGGMPGQKMATYITAHSSSDGSRWPLNAISDEKLVKVGSPVVVTTAHGVLTYAVTELFSLPRADFAKTKYATPPEADMLVITSCYTYDLNQQTRVLIAERVK